MTRPPFHPSLKRAAFFPSHPTATPFPLDAAPPPPMLRQQSSIASYASHGGSSSLDDMESDVEGLVMSFLTYSEVRACACV